MAKRRTGIEMDRHFACTATATNGATRCSRPGVPTRPTTREDAANHGWLPEIQPPCFYYWRKPPKDGQGAGINGTTGYQAVCISSPSRRVLLLGFQC